MSTFFTINTKNRQLKIDYVLTLVLLISYHLSIGQISSAPCNTESPWVTGTYSNMTSSIIDDVPVFLLCTGSVTGIANLVDANLNNSTTISITGINCDATISAKDNDSGDTYPAGTWAGFNISTSGLLPGGTILSTVTIETWNNGAFRESYNAGAALSSINLGLNVGSRTNVGFNTTMDFDELRIKYQTLLGLGFTANVYYPVIIKFCAGPTPDCNTSTSLSQTAFPALVSNAGVTGITLGTVTNVNNVVSTSTSDFGTITLPVGIAATGYIEVKDQLTVYPSGYFAGFEIANLSLLDLQLLTNTTISTYLDNVPRESFAGNALLLGAPVLGTSGRQTVGFVTSMTFNKIRFTINQTVGLDVGATNVYNAIIKRYCTGPALDCNVITSLIENTFPVNVDPNLTGITGVACSGCSINAAQNVIDSDVGNLSTITLTGGIAVNGAIAVKDVITTYPAGTYAGFEYQNAALIGANVLDNIQIATYMNGSLVETSTNSTILAAGSSLLGGSGRQIAGFVTTLPFNTIRISITQAVGLNLGTTIVYRALVQNMCAGPALPCNTPNNMVLPTYPVVVNSINTGIDGLACIGCSINNRDNLVDSNLSNFADITLLAGVGISGSISVKDAVTDYAANTFVGFDIENTTLLSADILDGITISTYLNGSPRETRTGISGLIEASTSLITGNGRQTVGFVTTMSFDEVKLTVSNTISANLGMTKIYKMVTKKFCDVTLACDQTYYLSEPQFPVIVNSLRTGVQGVACALCSVADAPNVITASNTDFATITTAAGVAADGSISVLDALSTFPAGSTAGFVIQDMNNLIQADLFNSLTITTYLNGEVRETKNASDLIDLAVLTNWIGMGAGVYNLGFPTTMTYDEIKISVGSLASVLNVIRVYSAYVDSRGAYGSGLNCCPTTAPQISMTTASNACPTSTINLNSLVTSPTPTNSTLVWYDGNNPATATLVTNATLISTSGTYYSFYYNNASPNNCYSQASAAVTTTIIVCDTDGDGQPDLQDPSPNDGCVYSIGHTPTTENTSATWKSGDCDGDGATNGIEIASSGGSDPVTNPLNGCDYNITEQVIANISSTWSNADCDVDGMTNGEELTGVNNPDTPADPGGFTTNPRNPDTDGDGVTDGLERTGPDALTDANNPCSLNLSEQGTPSSAWNAADCDNDGLPNGTDPDPLVAQPLKVSLISVSGYWDQKHQGNIIEWVTLSEVNNDYFEIERSINGTNFTPVGKIKGASNSITKIEYHFSDEQIELDGRYLYRIRQVDFDGKFSYSEIITIYVNIMGKVEYKLFPNPSTTHSVLKIKSQKPIEFTQMSIYDDTGRRLFNDVLCASCGHKELNAKLDASTFSNGLYHVVIDVDGKLETLRWLIIN
jgi:hypothetical protein